MSQREPSVRWASKKEVRRPTPKRRRWHGGRRHRRLDNIATQPRPRPLHSRRCACHTADASRSGCWPRTAPRMARGRRTPASACRLISPGLLTAHRTAARAEKTRTKRHADSLYAAAQDQPAVPRPDRPAAPRTRRLRAVLEGTRANFAYRVQQTGEYAILPFFGQTPSPALCSQPHGATL